MKAANIFTEPPDSREIGQQLAALEYERSLFSRVDVAGEERIIDHDAVGCGKLMATHLFAPTGQPAPAQDNAMGWLSDRNGSPNGMR